jgi:hypothetical protein
MLDTHFIVIHSMTTYSAYCKIAGILEMTCLNEPAFHINALGPTLPPALAPTSQQLIIPHKPYVDMMPWASLRNRLLDSLVSINEEEFTKDMTSSDLKVWGNVPWDPMSWEVGPEFAKKWWFLVDEGIIDRSNFWRAQRGEVPVVLSRP